MELRTCLYCKKPIPLKHYSLKQYLERKFCSIQCNTARGNHTIHNGKNTHPNLYRRWKDMRNRCNNPNNLSYSNYGGRGIKVCNRWDNFSEFLHDMGSDYRPELTLDRIDNDGDYAPGNCRWVDRIVQANNRRQNNQFTVGAR